MNKEALFKAACEQQLIHENINNSLSSFGIIFTEEYPDSFYVLFEEVMKNLLSEEGQTYFFESILFRDYTVDEMYEAMEPYFI